MSEFNKGDKVIPMSCPNVEDHIHIVVGYLYTRPDLVAVETPDGDVATYDFTHLALYREPVVNTFYLNLYPSTIGSPKATRELADLVANYKDTPERVGCLKLTVSSTGKLISALNVEV